MNRSSPQDEKILDRFLRTQCFHCSPTTLPGYRSILRDFQCFVAAHSAGAPLSLPIIQQWLHARSLDSTLSFVYCRAQLVERFLEWMTVNGTISSNPLTALHREYGTCTKRIVQALLSEDVAVALAKLTPAPRFASFLGQLMQEHICQMRALGYRYKTREYELLRFDRFLQRHPELTGKPLSKLVETWAQESPGLNSLRQAQEVGRIVSKAMHRLDPSVPILPGGTDADRRARRVQRRPHLYSDEEVRRLLDAARSLPSPKAPLRPLTLYTMLVLAYCAGLRRGEIAKLTLADVQLQDGTIDIRDTKFFKHRRLPLAPGVIAVLKHYLSEREKAGAPTRPGSGVFWQQTTHRPYTGHTIGTLVVEALRRAGLKPSHGKVGPRQHDLRHSLVGHRMREWYRDGVNPQTMLPYLSKFLGHKDLQSTLAYINITPELLQMASERFRKHAASALLAPESAQ
jgi:integrase/recombinase XerD